MEMIATPSHHLCGNLKNMWKTSSIPILEKLVGILLWVAVHQNNGEAYIYDFMIINGIGAWGGSYLDPYLDGP